MDGIIPKLSRADKRRLEKRCRKLKDGGQRTRYLIILNLAEDRSVTDTAKALKLIEAPCTAWQQGFARKAKTV